MKSILVVDDDNQTLELLEIVLEQTGYEIIVASKMPTEQEVVSQNPRLILLNYFIVKITMKIFALN